MANSEGSKTSMCEACKLGANPWEILQCHFCCRVYHQTCAPSNCIVCSSSDLLPLPTYTFTDDPYDTWPRVGSSEFLRTLENLELPSGEEMLIQLHGDHLNLDFFNQYGFPRPILVKEKIGLDISMPHAQFSVDDVVRYCGENTKVDVINVLQQMDEAMSLKEFAQYFNRKDETDNVYNLISLEFSDTPLTKLVKPPKIVHDLSWVSTAGFDHLRDALNGTLSGLMPYGEPQVLRYCLISAKDSFTDFHVDFGGTSVWYHVLWGKKVFYLIEPTEENLVLYQTWMQKENRSRSFFGDQVENCYRCEFLPGNTVFIPAGWIHAVHTPEDSLVFGGNFLHYYNVPMSLRVFELEQILKTPEKYMFPDFKLVCFTAAKNLVEIIGYLKSMKKKPSYFHFQSIESLLPKLQNWYENEEKVRQDVKNNAEEPINCKKLFAQLLKILKKKPLGSPKKIPKPEKGEIFKPPITIQLSLSSEESLEEEFFEQQRPSPKNANLKLEESSASENESPITMKKKLPIPEFHSKILADFSSADDSDEEKPSLVINLPAIAPTKGESRKRPRKPKQEKEKKPSTSSAIIQKSEKKSPSKNAPGSNSHITLPQNPGNVNEIQAPNSPDLATNSNKSSFSTDKPLPPKKFKKGLATPKQRLGKILKIKPR